MLNFTINSGPMWVPGLMHPRTILDFGTMYVVCVVAYSILLLFSVAYVLFLYLFSLRISQPGDQAGCCKR